MPDTEIEELIGPGLEPSADFVASLRRRTVHALMFEGGLVLICIPVMAWWLQVGYLEALVYEAGLIALFIVYTYAFTWGFDRIFGLPASAR